MTGCSGREYARVVISGVTIFGTTKGDIESPASAKTFALGPLIRATLSVIIRSLNIEV